MNNLRVLRVEHFPFLELPFKKIEEEREMSRELNKLELVHENEKCMFGLTHLHLDNTKILEVLFPLFVFPNLQILSLWWCE